MRVGSLFTGIGGIDLGLTRAGMSIAWKALIALAVMAAVILAGPLERKPYFCGEFKSAAFYADHPCSIDETGVILTTGPGRAQMLLSPVVRLPAFVHCMQELDSWCQDSDIDDDGDVDLRDWSEVVNLY